ncbi:hypothetical protein F3Y22_tig00110577pilonHSYRG00088 [Hibiscus syriacus]|uniref:Auxin-responsive protein n=1 Tax=Hibiscus syriacus TaxID=106335 RepID=A0A6A3A5P3_HIBSY|nr:hypothetical protein F3Y22_tig00110577pilonHSYRG00088 [Hibiscus syriacus]
MKTILRKDGCLAAISERLVDFTYDNKWIEIDENDMANFHLALVDELTSLRCAIGEQERAELLLQSLHDSYDQLIISLTNNNVTSLVFNNIASVVLQEENRRKNKEDRQGHLKKDCWSLNKNSNPQGNTANTSDDGDALYCEASATMEGRKRFADIWLIDSGSNISHDLKKRMVFRGALVVLKGEKIVTNLYMLKGETLLEAEASVASCSSDSAMLWHRKLGHMSEQGMKVLVEQNLLPGLIKVSLTLCEHCITSKQYRLKFNTSNSRGKSVLELVHSDEWKAPVTSLGGAKYFVSFIDDYSRRCWVYPIKKKLDVFSTFKNFKALVELDYENKIKCFRTYNGGEYTKTINTTFYLVNRAPSTAIELKTPMEMWIGKPADYSNLHVFGSIVHVMYNSQEISELDPKSRKCKFLGYGDGVKGYRLWDPTTRKVIISRDVIFVEDKLQRKEEDKPTHDEQELESSEAPTTRQSDRVRRRPNWHLDYVIEGNIAYCLLTEDGEPSIYQEEGSQLVTNGSSKSSEMVTIKLRGIVQDWWSKDMLKKRLNKSMYGLKQAPRCLFKRFDSFIMCLGYNKLNAYHCAYFKSEEERMKMSRVPYASTVKSLMFAMICTRPDIAQAGRVSAVATSTTEAEYVAATQAIKEAIRLKMLLEEFGHNQEDVSYMMGPSCGVATSPVIPKEHAIHPKSSTGSRGGEKAAFVKVSLDGATFLRKVDLRMYKSYQQLSDALAKMLSSFTIDPKDPLLRSELIRYGEMAQACYDAFDFDPFSKYYGSCRFTPRRFFDSLAMADHGYMLSKYLFATSNINLPNFFKKSVDA